jgi:hypothetical protein
MSKVSRLRPQVGDELEIAKSDGFRVFGTFKGMDETFIKVRGNLGDLIGKEILVPMSLVTQITIIKKASRDAF